MSISYGTGSPLVVYNVRKGTQGMVWLVEKKIFRHSLDLGFERVEIPIRTKFEFEVKDGVVVPDSISKTILYNRPALEKRYPDLGLSDLQESVENTVNMEIDKYLRRCGYLGKKTHESNKNDIGGDTMVKAIRMYETGGPEVLRWEDYDPGQPGPGEVLVRHEAVGVNFVDVYQRTGLYTVPSFPAILGQEGAGFVQAIGKGVTEVKINDRVAYAAVPPGAYAEARIIPAHRLVKLPEGISTRQAAGMMLRGMTARYLLHGCYQVKGGDRILIHAAAGGVGLIVCQWAKHMGATVIGTVGSQEKAELAQAHGCDHPILYKEEDFVSRVREITDGSGVDVVYDSVGQSTFMKSLDCLRPRGMMVAFGQSSGSIPPFDVGILAAKGSLFLTRPTLMTYVEKREDLLAHARDLFEMVEKALVKIEIRQTYPLAEAARAHRDLEGRKTTGSTILIP